MAKVTGPRILTANRLLTGEVVYWSRGVWVPSLSHAEVLVADEAEAALARAQASVATGEVVTPYLFPLRDGAPAEEREVIRAAGPTVRLDLGKQSPPARNATRSDLPTKGEVDSVYVQI
jgi:hypothetical protein